jgi:hypothetical protein
MPPRQIALHETAPVLHYADRHAQPFDRQDGLALDQESVR